MALSEAILERLRTLFAPNDREAAAELLESHGAAGVGSSERILIAALKLSGGDLERLVDALVLAETDWRDLLVVAGFAYDTGAHLKWWPPERRPLKDC